MSLNFDFLDSLFSSNASQYTSTTSLNQSMSKSSMQSYGCRRGKKLPRNMNRRSSIQSSVSVSSKNHLQSPGSSHDGAIIEYVSDSQKPGILGKKPSPSQSQTKDRALDPRKLRDALTPIRETTYEEDAQQLDTHRGDKTSTVSVALTKAPTKVPGRKMREVITRTCRILMSFYFFFFSNNLILICSLLLIVIFYELISLPFKYLYLVLVFAVPSSLCWPRLCEISV